MSYMLHVESNDVVSDHDILYTYSSKKITKVCGKVITLYDWNYIQKVKWARGLKVFIVLNVDFYWKCPITWLGM